MSNDRRFRHKRRIPPTRSAHWTLLKRGPERRPRRVYVRFGDAKRIHHDDIVLDRTPPAVRRAAVRRAAGSRFRVSVGAADRTSGIAAIQVTPSKARPGKALAYRRSITVGGARPRFVRVRDRAGNYSRWRSLR